MLLVPRGVVRPTADRVREAVFSILGDRVPGARVLDLFAGSGALGIEALSRGATSATFVEQHRRAVESIRQNLQRTGLSDRAVVIQAEVAAWLRNFRHESSFDLLFADPPYQRDSDEPLHRVTLLQSPLLPRILAPGGLLVVESARDAPPPVPDPWKARLARDYGETLVQILELHRPSRP
jgi:16S rRNA (guanine966-N2)-methyltransferase